MARMSPWKPFTPNCIGYEYYFEKTNSFSKPDNKIKMNSIRNVCKKMVSGTPDVGVNAIRALAQEIRELSNYVCFPGAKHFFKLQIKLLSTFISEFETTGTFYRTIYAQYIQNLAEEAGIENLNIFARRMFVIGEKWKHVVGILTKGDDVIQNINLFALELNKLADEEEHFFTQLLKVL